MCVYVTYIKHAQSMKTILQVLGVVLVVAFLQSCGSADYKHQPWMPSKVKGKPSHHNSTKKARLTFQEYNLF